MEWSSLALVVSGHSDPRHTVLKSHRSEMSEIYIHANTIQEVSKPTIHEQLSN